MNKLNVDRPLRSVFLFEKLKPSLNPYILNWILDFLTNWRQRVGVDGIETAFLHISRGVQQGTVIGPFLFSLFNEINPENPERNLQTKFADDLTVSIPVKMFGHLAFGEVNNLKGFSSKNRMTLNKSKTWEMVVSGRTKKLSAPKIDISDLKHTSKF